jgi:DNA modification methylase
MEFRSRLEDLMPAEELRFPASPGFGKYKSVMPEEAVAHPAKFNTYLVEFLIDNFTKEGDVILDPMAGTGILGVIAALRGRNAVQVEIEPRFYEWMEKARQNVEKIPTLGRKGWIINILGDARRLSELLRQTVDVAITSPPYAETISHKSGGSVRVKRVGISTVTARTYSTSNDNIGNLPLGELDVIIDKRPERKGTLWGYTKEVSVTPENVTQIQGSKRLDRGRGETYVEAMMKVYSEMYKVLKPNGYAIVVIKPFIRNKRVVDLPYYTWLMMERVGFKLVEPYKFRLPTKSFWRILYYKKHPEVPEIAHEYVIAAVKTSTTV